MQPRIGIVGMACRLRGAHGLDALWRCLSDAPRPFAPLPLERFDPAVYGTELPSHQRNVSVRAALLDDYDIDWRALRLPPMQVERMHRMERVAFATMIEALEDAGIGTDNDFGDRARVFIAASTLGPDPHIDHAPRIRRFEVIADLGEALAEHLPGRHDELQTLIANRLEDASSPIHPDSFRATASMTAGRLANLFDFRGGHFAADAANASSLAALHEAAAALHAGVCDLAVVCGLSPLLTPVAVAAFAHRYPLAADRPQPFAVGANGTVLGEGCAAVVLMRESAPREMNVYAYIDAIACASARSVDPEPDSSVHAARAAIAKAPAAAALVGRIESRASGVAAWDSAELQGLRTAYETRACSTPVPSVASSVPRFGFLQAASGMVAVVNSALALSRGGWPDSAEDSRPRAAAVSDAGLGPATYHAILTAPDVFFSDRPESAVMPRTEIAIVGMGLAVPGAHDLSTFWQHIINRVDAVGDLPSERWDANRLISADTSAGAVLQTRLAGVVTLPDAELANGPMATAGGISCDAAELLAAFSAARAVADAHYDAGRVDAARVQVIFGQIAHRAGEVAAEARMLFLHQLRLSADALRAAGVSERDLADVIATARTRYKARSQPLTAATLDACSGLSAAARVAQLHGWRGRALSVDAACASSLASIDIGVRALLDGSADLVVAGGVSYHLLPEYYVALGLLGALSPRGVPAFQPGAAGLVPSEGAGAIVLKRLADAVADGNRVYAVIRGVGTASDGRGDSIFAPNAIAQERAIRSALDRAGFDPATVDLVEAHGAATPLGDRAELDAFAAVYCQRAVGDPLSVGSVKYQLGHMSSAAGIVGTIKLALSLSERVLPPGSTDDEPDPALPFRRVPMELATSARPWIVAPGRTRRAAVNAYGLGDINYHILLEERARDASGESVTTTDGLAHPEPAPARGTDADRFTVELVPVALPDRAPLFPLRGRHVAVVPDRGEHWRALLARLERAGCRATLLDRSVADPAATLDVQHLDGVIDLSAFGAATGLLTAAPATVERALHDVGTRTFAIVRALYDRLEDATRPCCFVAVTSLGGDLGVSGRNGGDITGAYLLGLTKALKQELPHLIAKTIDFRTGETSERVGDAVVREIEDGNDRMDVAYRDTRLVANLRRDNFDTSTPLLRAIRPGDVVLVSGGGRGVLFECARVIARLGARVIVTGRTTPPAGTEFWLDLSTAEFETYRHEEFMRRRALDATLTPVRFTREFDVIVRQRALHHNLQRARMAALSLEYAVCDITDADAVAELVARIRSTHGRLDAIIHGAMVEHSTRAAKKTPDVVQRTAATKVLGLVNLLRASAAEPPGVLLAFGSGAGRFGNRGQTDYAAANALMCAWLTAYRHYLPDTHCATINWTAWRSVGAAVADAAIADMVQATGVSSISVEEGEYWFLSEYALGASAESVVFEERLLHEWPFLGSRAEGTGARAVELDDEGHPLVPGQWPLIDRCTERTHPTLRCERRLVPADDHFLPQHRLYDVPILPFTFGCELLAEAAALCCPGYEIHCLHDVRIDVPVKLFRDEPLLLRSTVTRATIGATAALVHVETRSDLFRNDRPLLLDRLHHSARVTLRQAGSMSPAQLEIPERPGALRSRSLFSLVHEPIHLGPMFCRTAWIQISEHDVVGTVRAPRLRGLMARTSYPILQVDPMVLDGAFQIAANWDGYQNGFVSVPMSVDRLMLGRRRRNGENARVRAAVTAVDGEDVLYDITIASETGDLLATVHGLRLRRVAQVALNASTTQPV